MMENEIKQLGISNRELEELKKVSKNLEKDYQKLLKKYPIQYLIGYVNFYGYKITVNESVLIPRYETEYLVEKTINYSKKIFKDKKLNIIDLGTGSGCIAVTLAKELNSNVSAVDISKSALEIAKNNAKENNVNINFIENDMLNNIDDKFDIIVSNPPYVKEQEEIMESVKLYEPNIALYATDNGLHFYKQILKESVNKVNDKFIIVFEIGYDEGQDIIDLAKYYFPNSKISLEKDLSNKDRYIFIINE